MSLDRHSTREGWAIEIGAGLRSQDGPDAFATY